MVQPFFVSRKFFRILWVYLCVVLHSQAFADVTIRIDGSTGAKPLVSALAIAYQSQNPNTGFQIGSGLKPEARIQALLEGEIDIAMASHGFDAKRVAQSGFEVNRIAKTAVVVGVNRRVGVNNLGHKQLCDIYSGETTNWSELGGNDARIFPFIRPFNEVDTEVFVAHIPCFKRLALATSVEVKKKSGQMARALASTPGAIGMTTMVRVAQSGGDITALALQGVQPTASNLQHGRYTLSRDVFLITQMRPAPHIASFVRFIRSETGTEVLVKNNAAPAE